MNKAELLELIINGENSGVEFKRDDLRPERLAKEVVALANFQGGRILVGVEDDGAITGIQRTDLERWVMDTVFGRKVHPMILPFYEEVQVDEQHRVAVITISQGVTKPYVMRHRGREDILYPCGQHLAAGLTRTAGAALRDRRHAPRGEVSCAGQQRARSQSGTVGRLSFHNRQVSYVPSIPRGMGRAPVSIGFHG